MPEDEISPNSDISSRLRLQSFQCIAMLNLLIKKQYEPCMPEQYHFSTLLQQTLSVIAQYGGVRAEQLWSLLCKTGSFSLVDEPLYIRFLRSLGAQNLIHQALDGQLILGAVGERLVNHFTFYSAFNTPDEYRLEADGRILGSLPVLWPLIQGQLIVFAAKRWEILSVDPEKKVILLQRAKGGKAPKFASSNMMVATIVRQEMLRIYHNREIPLFLNKTALELFTEGCDTFHALNLSELNLIQDGRDVHLITWLGDRTTNAIAMLFVNKGARVNSYWGILTIGDSIIKNILEIVDEILKQPLLTPIELTDSVANIAIEKHDHFLPDEILKIGYAHKYFDVQGAYLFLSSMATNHEKYSC